MTTKLFVVINDYILCAVLKKSSVRDLLRGTGFFPLGLVCLCVGGGGGGGGTNGPFLSSFNGGGGSL